MAGLTSPYSSHPGSSFFSYQSHPSPPPSTQSGVLPVQNVGLELDDGLIDVVGGYVGLELDDGLIDVVGEAVLSTATFFPGKHSPNDMVSSPSGQKTPYPPLASDHPLYVTLYHQSP